FSLSSLSLRDAAQLLPSSRSVATSGRLDLRRGTVTSASVSPIFPDQSPAVARLETIGNCRIPTESSEAPGVRLIHMGDPRKVQLARTSSRRRTKETTRAINLAPDPPPKCRISLGDSAEFSAAVKKIN
ncbi:hypothetical protein Prudu_227S000500, partial [Prunus dulcis]